MIVQRIEFRVKVGCMEKAVELAKRASTLMPGIPANFRFLTSNIGRMGILVDELEFNSFADLERFWKEWFAAPGVPELLEEWHEVVADTGSVSEVWTIVGS